VSVDHEGGRFAGAASLYAYQLKVMCEIGNMLTTVEALYAYQRRVLRDTGIKPTTVALTRRERRELVGDLRRHFLLPMWGGKKGVPVGAKVLEMIVVAAPEPTETAEPQDQSGTISGPGYDAL